MLLLYEMERRSRECKRGDKKGKGEEGMENNRDGGDGDKLKCVRNLIKEKEEEKTEAPSVVEEAIN